MPEIRRAPVFATDKNRTCPHLLKRAFLLFYRVKDEISNDLHAAHSVVRISLNRLPRCALSRALISRRGEMKEPLMRRDLSGIKFSFALLTSRAQMTFWSHLAEALCRLYIYQWQWMILSAAQLYRIEQKFRINSFDANFIGNSVKHDSCRFLSDFCWVVQWDWCYWKDIYFTIEFIPKNSCIIIFNLFNVR